MTFLKIFLSAGIFVPIISMITGFFPILQIWILYYLGSGENSTVLNFLFALNLFAYAFIEELIKYFSAIFWWKKYNQAITKKLLFYIFASASGLAVFEKSLSLFFKIKDGVLESIPWITTAPLFVEAILLHSIIAMLLYPFIKITQRKNNRLYFYAGLMVVSLIHAFYNYLIIIVYL